MDLGALGSPSHWFTLMGQLRAGNHTLSRALLTEAGHRFNWLSPGKQALRENQLPEAHYRRGITDQLGATPRRVRQQP
ncbi:MAG TPA: hypothetical protein VIU11_02085 [Nakamurella sp.]